MTIEFLVTHSGGFHADEVLSSVVLTRLFPQAKQVRSRAPEWITPAADRIIYDVGGAYDPEARIFDHHQRGAPMRDGSEPYSSFGLIWKHYGHEYLAALSIPHAPKASAICPGGMMKASVPLGVTCPFQAAGTVRGSAVQASSRR